MTGPYDVIVRAEAESVDELGKLVVAQHPGGRGHHPHADLPGGPPVAAPGSGPSARRRRLTRPGSDTRALALRLVALDGEIEQPLDELGVGQARGLPELRVHRDRR